MEWVASLFYSHDAWSVTAACVAVLTLLRVLLGDPAWWAFVCHLSCLVLAAVAEGPWTFGGDVSGDGIRIAAGYKLAWCAYVAYASYHHAQTLWSAVGARLTRAKKDDGLGWLSVLHHVATSALLVGAAISGHTRVSLGLMHLHGIADVLHHARSCLKRAGWIAPGGPAVERLRELWAVVFLATRCVLGATFQWRIMQVGCGGALATAGPRPAIVCFGVQVGAFIVFALQLYWGQKMVVGLLQRAARAWIGWRKRRSELAVAPAMIMQRMGRDDPLDQA